MGHEPRFNATIWVEHPERMTQMFLKLDRGEMPSEAEIVDFGEFTGGLNYSEAHQDEFVPVGYKKEGKNFVPINSGAPGDWPLEVQPAMWGGERRSGDNGVPFANPRAVTVVPITIPAGTSGVLTMSVAEYRSSPSFKQATISKTAGDFLTALAFSQGNTAAPSVTVGGNVQAGDTVYFNFRFWSSDLNAPSTDDTPQGCSYGGGWPPT